jgi:hypothetical protein
MYGSLRVMAVCASIGLQQKVSVRVASCLRHMDDGYGPKIVRSCEGNWPTSSWGIVLRSGVAKVVLADEIIGLTRQGIEREKRS